MKHHWFNTFPIQWYEGMLIMPQHMQQNDLLYEHVRRYHLQHLAPYHWGVVHLLLDETMLNQGVLRIVSFEGIMPDGTIIFFPQGVEDSLEISIKNTTSDTQEEQLIFLSIPAKETGLKHNIAESYVPIEETSSDLNMPDAQATLMRLKPRLMLHANEKIPAQRLSMPIAKIRVHNQKIVKTTYLPPSLMLENTCNLFKICRELVGSVRDKLVYLKKKIDNRGTVSTSLFDAQSIWQFDMMRRAFITGIGALEAALNAPKIHPFSLYQALLTLAIQCAALRWGEVPPKFAPYSHENMAPVFDSLIAFIKETLDQVEESYRVYAFEKKDRTFSLQLNREWSQKVLILGIKAPVTSTEEAMVSWMNDAIITSENNLETARDNRILGAQRIRLQTAAHLKLVPDRGTVLYQINLDENFVVAGETLYILNVSDTDDNRPESIVFYMSEGDPPTQDT